jgi:nitrosocyanin
MHGMARIFWGMLVGAVLLGSAVGHAAEPATYSGTIVNIEYQGSKIWVPGTLVVKKGTKVTLNLINNVPSDPKDHGFAIPAYGIAETVNRGEPKKIEFTADKAGIFPITCHLHPAHVGGQLIVLE